MLRLVSELADLEARLGPAGRFVFQHSRRHYVGFIRDIMMAGSVGFVQTAVEHVGLFSVAKKAMAQRFIIDARASNRHVFESSIWTVAHRRGLCRVAFHGALEDAENGFAGSADVKNAFHQMRMPGGVQAFFCPARCSRIRSWLHGKND